MAGQDARGTATADFLDQNTQNAPSRVDRRRSSTRQRSFHTVCEANARRKSQGWAPSVVSPMALEAVRRIDALFEIERTTNGLEGRGRAWPRVKS